MTRGHVTTHANEVLAKQTARASHVTGGDERQRQGPANRGHAGEHMVPSMIDRHYWN